MPSRHGTKSRYVQGCSCKPCRQANADYSAKYNTQRGRRKGTQPRDQYGDSGYPGAGKLKCLVCGEPVNTHPIAQSACVQR